MMKREKKKVEKPSTSANKLGEECQYCKKFNCKKRSVFGTLTTQKRN
jgi:hypothetical protein